MFTNMIKLIFIAAIAAVACSEPVAPTTFVRTESRATTPRKQRIVAHGLALFPDESIADWKAYADQVSTIEVVSERSLELDPEVERAQEGYVSRRLQVRIESTIWSAPNVRPREGLTEMPAIGWTLKGDHMVDIDLENSPRMMPGGRYVLALTQLEDGAVARLAPGAVFAEAGDQIAMDDIGMRGQSVTAKALSQSSIIDIRKALDEVRIPDDVAEFQMLPPRKRVRAVVEARNRKL